MLRRPRTRSPAAHARGPSPWAAREAASSARALPLRPRAPPEPPAPRCRRARWRRAPLPPPGSSSPCWSLPWAHATRRPPRQGVRWGSAHLQHDLGSKSSSTRHSAQRLARSAVRTKSSLRARSGVARSPSGGALGASRSPPCSPPLPSKHRTASLRPRARIQETPPRPRQPLWQPSPSPRPRPLHILPRCASPAEGSCTVPNRRSQARPHARAPGGRGRERASSRCVARRRQCWRQRARCRAPPPPAAAPGSVRSSRRSWGQWGSAAP